MSVKSETGACKRGEEDPTSDSEPTGVGMNVRPEPKKPQDSLSDYLKYFGRVAAANGWSDAESAKIFPGLLEVSSNVLEDLDTSTLASFDRIKSALTPSEECYREAGVQKFFWCTAMRADESVQEYASRCRSAVQECYPRFAKANKDQLARDRFVHGLVSNLKSAVLKANCEKWENAVQAALLAEGVNKTLGGYQGKKTTHEDMDRMLSDRGSTLDGRVGVLTCYRCHQQGHIAKDCSRPRER